ncbi:MAG: DUF433 domain-containing protein [Gemmataceae bacterium]|nr:DUF433 domain-containing protein [Gemmataceae bacterium]
MTSGVTYPHIVKENGDPARLEKHARIRVAQIVMDYLAYGWSVDEMCRQHAYLTPAEAHAAMAYYFDHQEEIDGEIHAEVDDLAQTRARAGVSPILLKLRAKGLL